MAKMEDDDGPGSERDEGTPSQDKQSKDRKHDKQLRADNSRVQARRVARKHKRQKPTDKWAARNSEELKRQQPVEAGAGKWSQWDRNRTGRRREGSGNGEGSQRDGRSKGKGLENERQTKYGQGNQQRGKEAGVREGRLYERQERERERVDGRGQQGRGGLSRWQQEVRAANDGRGRVQTSSQQFARNGSTGQRKSAKNQFRSESILNTHNRGMKLNPGPRHGGR